jgi:hypothetical protein
LGGLFGESDGARDFGVGHADKEPKFDHLRLRRGFGDHLVEGLMDGETPFLIMAFGRASSFSLPRVFRLLSSRPREQRD